MELTRIFVEERAGGRARLCGEVRYDRGPVRSEIFWFEVPGPLAGFLSVSGNPWLACLLPLAVTLGEPLRISAPLDTALHRGATELMHIGEGWSPHLRAIPIEADVPGPVPVAPAPKRAMTFFSGGIDSFFTILRYEAESGMPIGDLVKARGLDIPLQNSQAFERLRARLRKAADELGKNLIDISTNLRETRLRETQWGELSHGAALASIGLALEGGYDRIVISSTHSHDSLLPWGSHPATDPLLSTTWTQVVHYGAVYTRVQKTEAISTSDIALRSLKVCALTRSEENCSACNKCYRTMITLSLLGVLDRCPTFNTSKFDVKNIPSIYSQDKSAQIFLEEVRDLARAKGREDIAGAIEESFRHSRRLHKWVTLAEKLNETPFIWRLAEPVERFAMRHSIK